MNALHYSHRDKGGITMKQTLARQSCLKHYLPVGLRLLTLLVTLLLAVSLSYTICVLMQPPHLQVALAMMGGNE